MPTTSSANSSSVRSQRWPRAIPPPGFNERGSQTCLPSTRQIPSLSCNNAQWSTRICLRWVILGSAYLSECHPRNLKRLLWVSVRLVSIQVSFVPPTSIIVSENKPVGPTRGGKEVRFSLTLSRRVHRAHQGDLLGDDITSPAPQFNGQTMQNSQDLLAEIFGSGTPTGTSTSPQAASSISPQPQKSSIQDILGLFDASPNPASPAPAPGPSASAFSLSQIEVQSPVQTQTPPAQPQPLTAPRLTSYTAYEKNELKITLTPQTSAARPGVVNIMARFQVSGTNTATGLHFQAAVPKVC